jgi:hypothetical protein
MYDLNCLFKSAGISYAVLLSEPRWIVLNLLDEMLSDFICWAIGFISCFWHKKACGGIDECLLRGFSMPAFKSYDFYWTTPLLMRDLGWLDVFGLSNL